jgi:hypothetical protein
MHRALVLVSLTLGACGSGFGEASCDLRAAEPDEPRCQERTGIQGTPAFSAFCDPLGGEGINGPCPDEDQIVAGCKSAAPAGAVIDWYYEPMTREAIALACSDDDAELVDP